MTTAMAATGRHDPMTSVQAVRPTVFVDGIPDPNLSVLRYTASLPFGERTAELAPSPEDPGVNADFSGRSLTLAVPHRLADGDACWDVLLEGRVDRMGRSYRSGSEAAPLYLRDRLAYLLNEHVASLGFENETARLRELVGRLAQVLQAELTWLGQTSEHADDTAIDLGPSSTIRSVLGPAFASLGIALTQELRLEDGMTRRSLAIRPQQTGRLSALPWPDDTGRGGRVVSVDAETDSSVPRQWLAVGARPVIEDTFYLRPAWDPSLENEPDAAYGRLSSGDFSRFGSVFRAWVLNEDGAYSEPPFTAGPAFDLGARFDTPGTLTAPLPLRDCLTQDASGRRIPPIVEVRMDDGSSWSRYAGEATIMTDRAGVLLHDDVLPASILAAAQAGSLQVRVTASATAPEPITARRWDGNPFSGPGPTHRIVLGDRFRWQRVASTSIHAASLALGELSAEAYDDRAALRSTLLARIDAAGVSPSSATVELAGAWTSLRPGDRVRDPLSPGVAIDRTPSRFCGPDARIASLLITFSGRGQSPRTRLRFN